MLSFKQFISEEFASPKIKGWMSSSGKPHLFDVSKEHAQSYHPSYRGSRDIHSAQHAGFVRFGSHPQQDGTTHHYINYSEEHPKGRQTALKAINFLKPHHNDYVTLNGMYKNKPDNYRRAKASEIAGTVSHARNYLNSESM